MAKKGRKQLSDQQEPEVVKKWKACFGNDGFGTLENWQHLCRDLGLGNHHASKTQCRKVGAPIHGTLASTPPEIKCLFKQALKIIWVNIPDFLNATDRPADVAFFPNQYALSAYTVRTRKFFPKRFVEKGSPLAALLAHIH